MIRVLSRLVAVNTSRNAFDEENLSSIVIFTKVGQCRRMHAALTDHWH